MSSHCPLTFYVVGKYQWLLLAHTESSYHFCQPTERQTLSSTGTGGCCITTRQSSRLTQALRRSLSTCCHLTFSARARQQILHLCDWLVSLRCKSCLHSKKHIPVEKKEITGHGTIWHGCCLLCLWSLKSFMLKIAPIQRF